LIDFSRWVPDRKNGQPNADAFRSSRQFFLRIRANLGEELVGELTGPHAALF
jgi:hypothetical protein